MEALLSTSAKYQKEQYKIFLDNIIPKAASDFIASKTEEDVAYNQGAYKKFKEWQAATAIPQLSSWLSVMTPPVFQSLLERERETRTGEFDDPESRKRKRETPREEKTSTEKDAEVRALRAKLKESNAKLRKLEADSAPTRTRKTPCCYNCNKEGHKVDDCTLPRDQARINANKKAMQDRINLSRVQHLLVAATAPSTPITTPMTLMVAPPTAPSLPPHVPGGGTWSTNTVTGQMIYTPPKNKTLQLFSNTHTTTGVHFDTTLQPHGWSISVGSTARPYTQSGLADTGAQLVVAGKAVYDHLISEGEDPIPLTDFVVGMLTPEHVATARCMFNTNIRIADPHGGTVTFMRQQVIIVDGTDEILLSDWCINKMGIKIYDLMSKVMASHPIIEGNAHLAPSSFSTLRRVRARPTKASRCLKNKFLVEFENGSAETTDDGAAQIPPDAADTIIKPEPWVSIPTSSDITDFVTSIFSSTNTSSPSAGVTEYMSSDERTYKRQRTLARNVKFLSDESHLAPDLVDETGFLPWDMHEDEDEEKPASDVTPDAQYLFDTACAHLTSLGKQRSLNADPLHLSPQDITEIQDEVDKMLLRFVASYSHCPDIPTLHPHRYQLLQRDIQQIISLVWECEDVFRIQQIPEDPPAEVEPYRHRFRDDAKVVWCADPRLTPTQSNDLNEIIQRYVRAGLVYENHRSIWSSRVNMQPKPSSNPPWRITIDLKRVNSQLFANQWPMPRLDELALHMKGHSYFGSTDAQGGYWQLLLHEDSRELFSFKTDRGTFTPTRIPQGSVDAVQWFHGQLHSLFTDMIPTNILQWI
jgi:hypothetical protein